MAEVDTLSTPSYAYLTHDHLGSTRGMWDGSIAQTGSWEFTPYGAPLTFAGPGDVTQQYTGHMLEPATGQYYAPFRFLNPEIGRWLSTEPFGLDGPNLYWYARAQPSSAIDPSGLWTLTLQGGAGLVGRVSIGFNGGQLSVKAGVGVGIGFSGSLDLGDDGPNPTACDGGSLDFGSFVSATGAVFGADGTGQGSIGTNGYGVFGDVGAGVGIPLLKNLGWNSGLKSTGFSTWGGNSKYSYKSYGSGSVSEIGHLGAYFGAGAFLGGTWDLGLD